MADRTAQIARVTQFDQRQAGMPLVIAPRAAVVRAAPSNGCSGCVEALRHLRRFEEHLTAALAGLPCASAAFRGWWTQPEGTVRTRPARPRTPIGCPSARCGWIDTGPTHTYVGNCTAPPREPHPTSAGESLLPGLHCPPTSAPGSADVPLRACIARLRAHARPDGSAASGSRRPAGT